MLTCTSGWLLTAVRDESSSHSAEGDQREVFFINRSVQLAAPLGCLEMSDSRLSVRIQSSNGCYPSVQCDGRCGLWLSRPWPRPRKDLGTAIQCETRKHELYRECLYQLGDGLVIAHLISNDIINSAPVGPDELWLASPWRRSRQSFKFWEEDHVELQL